MEENNNYVNAVRVTKMEDEYIIDFAYTEKKEAPITDEDVKKVATIFADEDTLRIIKKSIEIGLEKKGQ